MCGEPAPLRNTVCAPVLDFKWEGYYVPGGREAIVRLRVANRPPPPPLFWVLAQDGKSGPKGFSFGAIECAGAKAKGKKAPKGPAAEVCATAWGDYAPIDASSGSSGNMPRLVFFEEASQPTQPREPSPAPARLRHVEQTSTSPLSSRPMQATWSSGRAFTDALSLGEDPEAMAKFADVLLKRVVKKKAEATKEEL